jgi:hypothetical protein
LVAEFLDAPSEFWHDVAAGKLFLRPPPGVSDPADLEDLVAVTAQRLLDVGRRTSAGVASIQHLHFKGLELSGSRPTFLEEYEVPYRGDSDWTIHRGGAITFEGVADVSLSDSNLVALGGNAVFVSNDAKNVDISGNNISDVGDSGVAILGSMLRSTGLGARHFPLNVVSDSHILSSCAVVWLPLCCGTHIENDTVSSFFLRASGTILFKGLGVSGSRSRACSSAPPGL